MANDGWLLTANAAQASASQAASESTTISISWVPFYSGRQQATLLRSALKVLESASYPTIQFRHITGAG